MISKAVSAAIGVFVALASLLPLACNRGSSEQGGATPGASLVVRGELQTRPAAGRVIVLGVDALDFRFLDQLVSAGALPNFARLYREGSVGTIDVAPAGLPPESPPIWTSFATGQLPPEHGIAGFALMDDAGQRQLYSSSQRRVPAVWEIASRAGRRVGVVNWWCTYPAQPVDGFMISDRYVQIWAEREAKYWEVKFERDLDKSFYPPDLADALKEVAPASKLLGALTPQNAEAIDRHIFALAYRALAAHPVDLLLIYTRSLDELSHLKWHTHEPRPGEAPTADLIADFLDRYDGLLGELLERLGPADHLIVLSDHGFERETESGKPTTGMHKSPQAAVGTLILYGPRIRQGVRLQRVGVLDILPTILDLAGLPPAKNMAGIVATEAFQPAQRDLLPRVVAYDRAAGGEKGSETTGVDQSIIERLRALGYMQDEKR